MKRSDLTGVGWVVAAALAAQVARADPPPDVAEGRELYQRHCMVCHGPEGKGDGPLADELKTRPADLTRLAQRRGGSFPEIELREFIDGRRKVRGHGGGEMPIWGRIFAREGEGGKASEAEVNAKLDALVAYLRSIQAGAAVSQR
jgi:mono/diheme cytochrome c family protein